VFLPFDQLAIYGVFFSADHHSRKIKLPKTYHPPELPAPQILRLKKSFPFILVSNHSVKNFCRVGDERLYIPLKPRKGKPDKSRGHKATGPLSQTLKLALEASLKKLAELPKVSRVRRDSSGKKVIRYCQT
jgi:hypothetical protein